MKFYLGVTDPDWFSFLAKQEPEDVNFWQPGGNLNFHVLRTGAPFLFKLKSPYNAIGGIGFFSSHSMLPIDVAWNIFKERNGVDSYLKLRNKIIAKRNINNPFASNPNIGCIILTDPIFFHKEDWIEVPQNWSKNIVQGKSYDNTTATGRELWQRVEDKLVKYQLFQRQDSKKSQLILEEPIAQEYSKKYLTKIRMGQGAFRVQLTDAYYRRCSITGEKTLPALEAAHIKPYSESGPNHLSNGLLLRADLHNLFDSGYLTITKEYNVEVSRKIKEEFENGREYYKLNGHKLLVLPDQLSNQPNRQFIDWHNEHVYYG